ncbi:MAG TPA: CYTH domain-containing protein, partial [Rhodocyclaceae bacterium]|nr:CYTH domain-containing protein [Rhodocyclaceae bacterium]
MEIEFKLSCTPAAAARLSRQLGQLTGRKPQRLQLQNAYYDTPQQALRAHGIALRIRRQGKRLLQTVKCAGEVSGGLSRRPEWESAYRGAFDFSGIDNATVRERLETLAHQPGYRPILDTDFERCIWHWRPASDTCVEIALDRGTIRAGGKEEAICELELELVEGAPERLFDLVAQLGKLVPLFPAPLSKATRGSLLLAGAQADSAL